MDCEHAHRTFGPGARRTQSLCNDRCQNILYKAVFEHFKDAKNIAALLLTSKSFQNSSFGANFLVNFVIDKYSIALLESVLSPSSCFSLQFVPSLHIKQREKDSKGFNPRISNFVGELINTKYLHLSLRSLTLDSATNEVLSSIFGSSTCNVMWPHLRDLTLDQCRQDDAVMESISKNAPRLRTANLSSFSDVGLQHLSKLTGITSLKLTWGDKITGAGFEHIAKLSNITSFNLSFYVFDNDSLEYLSSIPSVTSLDLTGCRFGDVGVGHLSKLSSVTSLDLSLCDPITDASLEFISELTSMKSLNLRNCEQITDVGIEHISKLSGITSLDLARCSRITDVGFGYISKLSGITSLDLSCNRITVISDVGLEHISRLSRITSLDLSSCTKITDAGLQHLSKLSSITKLHLFGCIRITQAATKNFTAALPNCDITKYF